MKSGLLTLLIVLQVGLLFGELAYYMEFFVLTCIFCSIIGFSESAVNTTLISIAVYEYPYVSQF